MPYTVKIIDEIEVYSLYETKSRLEDTDNPSLYPKLIFTTYYIPLVDIDGEHPPKYLIEDRIIDELVEKELSNMNLSSKYKPYEDIEYSDIEMDTIYVSNEILCKDIDIEKKKSLKCTRFKVPIELC